MSSDLQTENLPIGVVGLGLMGTSIIVSLLAAGHPVIAIAPLPADEAGFESRLMAQLEACREAGILTREPNDYRAMISISEDYTALRNCTLVQECVIEKVAVKAQVYQQITAVVGAETVISSNTSAIPITELQQLVACPERFLGIHWAEPAFATRFLEITCGEKTDPRHAQVIYNMAHLWGKEPTLIKKDIRGFITNRLMYAVYREALFLVGQGLTTLADADKAFRYDAGSWMTLMGLFKRMDYEGLEDHLQTLNSLFPQLSNAAEVPEPMQEMVERHARGTQSRQGLYSYTAESASAWERSFAEFNKAIFHLARRYPGAPAVNPLP